MVHGTLLLAVTGLVLAGLKIQMQEISHAKIGVKFLIAVIILSIIIRKKIRKQEVLSKREYWTLFGLSLSAVAVAIFWDTEEGLVLPL